jgi:acyl-CoA reductase-like NAD-dependent aldehyde dehydrogenase
VGWNQTWTCPRQAIILYSIVFYDLADDATIATEEIFGPVLSVMKP